MSKSILVTITSANPLTSAQKREINDLVSDKLGKDVKYQYLIDAHVLSGLKISIGNQEFDATLAGTLQKLEPRLEQVVVTTPVALTTKQRKFLLDGLEKKLGFLPQLKEVVEPQVLGGVRLRIASAEYDYTLAKRLDKLQTFMGDQL